MHVCQVQPSSFYQICTAIWTRHLGRFHNLKKHPNVIVGVCVVYHFQIPSYTDLYSVRFQLGILKCCGDTD